MAPKKKGGGSRPPSRPPSRAGSDFDEASVTSTGRGSAADPDFETEEVMDDPFVAAVGKLYEKRTSTREEGLAALARLLTGDVQYEECMLRVATFSQMFLGSLKRGGPAEAGLAARALSLHLVTLGAGAEAEGIYKDALPVLEPVLLTSKSATTRAAAADALATACFVGGEGPHDALDCMALLARALAKAPQPAVLVSALRGWTLLLSTVPAWQLDSAFVEAHLSLLHNLLHSEDVEVRTAAGEAIALLYDSCSLTALPDSTHDRAAPKPGGLFSPAVAAAAVANSNGAPAGGSGGKPPLAPGVSVLSGNGSSRSLRGSTPERRRLDLGGEQGEGEGAAQPGGSAAATTNGAVVEAVPQPAAASEMARQPATAAASHQQAGQEEQQPPQQGQGPGAAPAAADAAGGEQALPGDELHAAEAHESEEHLEEEHESEEQQAEALAEPLSPVSPVLPTSPLPPRPARQPGTAAAAGSSGGVAVERLEDIVSRMRDLAKNRGDAQRKSKADRRGLRSAFRGLVDVVEDGAVAAQKVKLRHGDALVVDTLPGVIRLNFFRRLLAEGFQAHLQHNPLLHEVFNFRPRGEPAERLSGVEKRLYKSQSSAESKERTRQRKAERAMMSSYKGAAFLHGHD